MRRDYASLRTGLVGAWCPSLSIANTLLPDLSGRNASGPVSVASGSVSWPASGSGRSLLCGGNSAGTVIAPAPTITFGSAASISMWVKLRVATPASGVGLGGAGNTGFMFAEASYGASGGSHYPYIDGVIYSRAFRSARVNNITPSASVDRTAWHHVAIATNGSRWRMYQNAIMIADVAAESTVSFSASLFAIGRSGDTNAPTQYYWLDGWIDDVRLYSRGLTQADVRLLASRRGVGLTPYRQRRTPASSRRLWQNVAGTWKEARPYVNVGGVWKEAAVWQNVGGTWKN